ncbi:uncharacterized protein ARMOST_18976 [Armillaria ostoyae]|uniref:ABC-type Fe3+ transport system, periplasmic component n=1 Tax=Armillaria ostoyae TaxID=47428 RepID=A0A284S388_ARMOS|nr:uncharacterized protein ARMOST_18976 [Armillaria ostoyae]
MHITLFLLVTYFTAVSAAPLLEPIFGWLGGLSGSNSSSPSPAPATVETQSLDELYKLAVSEGGQLIVRAGGDTGVQQDPFVQSFQERFPDINITITVDLSKYHDGIIGRSLDLTGKAGVDVAHLQTYYDFVRWKAEGRRDGTKGMAYYLFTNTYATAKTSASDAPKTFLDYLDSKWKNRIVSVYPNDDDAVLFEFYKIQQTHGWQAIYDFIAQGINWVRGTATPSTVLLSGGPEAVTFTTATGFPDASSGVVEQLPPDSDSSALVIWAQRAAIFNTAEHPAAAKLYMNWLLSVDYQTVLASGGWSVRNDVPPKEGLKPLAEYGSMLDTKPFDEWMLDRELVERFRMQFEQLLGLPQGLSPIDEPAGSLRRIGVYQ